MIIRSLPTRGSTLLRLVLASVFILVLFGINPSPANSQHSHDSWITDIDEALEIASQTNRDLLIDFAGDRESRPSTLLFEQVLSQDAFRESVDSRFVRVLIRENRDGKEDSDDHETVTPFDRLVERYQIRGYPTLVVADSKGRPYGKLMGYHGESPSEVLASIDSAIEFRRHRDQHLSKAVSQQGIGRAEALDLAIRSIPSPWRVRHYRHELEQIISSDARNLVGLRVPYELELIRHDASADSLREQVSRLDNMAESFKLEPALLQEIHYTKAAFLYEFDRERARSVFELARSIDEDSSLGRKIERILQRSFAESDPR